MTAFDPATPRSLLLRGLPGLAEVARLLEDASHHYADDNHKEWSLSCATVTAAAKIAADNGWTFGQCMAAIAEINTLVTLEAFFNSVGRQLRAARASDAPAVQA